MRQVRDMMAKQKSHFVAMSATRRMICDLSSVSKSRLLDVYTGHLVSRASAGPFPDKSRIGDDGSLLSATAFVQCPAAPAHFT